jgi:glucose-1-phosphate thymidylyltransferase
VATIQNRQGFYVSCIEEIAWRQGWISSGQLLLLGQKLEKTEYGKYLIELSKQPLK